MKMLSAVQVGGGNRARFVYGPYARNNPEQLRIVALAEKDSARRAIFASENKLEKGQCFPDADSLFKEGRLADIAIIATQDRDHCDNAMKALALGYDLILEKPIAASMDECREILALATRLGRKVSVSHVLRFAPFYQKVKSLIESGSIGRLVTLSMEENVSWWHFAHSYVRGEWRREELSTPSILAKSCHDLDLIVWLSGGKCQWLESSGGLRWFTAANAPEGSSAYCMDGCAAASSCPYNAPHLYSEDETVGYKHGGWGPTLYSITDKKEPDALMEALRKGPYGRCVYHCDNDVADNQLVMGRMENGVDFTFLMTAFAATGHRTIHAQGSEGEITGDLEAERLVWQRFGGKAEEVAFNTSGVYTHQGHGGGDDRLLDEVMRYERGEVEANGNLTTLDLSMESHFMGFASEVSRKKGSTRVDMKEFRG